MHPVRQDHARPVRPIRVIATRAVTSLAVGGAARGRERLEAASEAAPCVCVRSRVTGCLTGWLRDATGAGGAGVVDGA